MLGREIAGVANMAGEKIPTSIIGVLSTIVAERYTHASINALFMYANAPPEIPSGGKPDKVLSWLRNVNTESIHPLAVLGVIIDDFMERDVNAFARSWNDGELDRSATIEAERQKVRDTLEKDGLTYARGGTILKAGSTSTASLEESVKKHGLPTVEIEIRRALEKNRT